MIEVNSCLLIKYNFHTLHISLRYFKLQRENAFSPLQVIGVSPKPNQTKVPRSAKKQMCALPDHFHGGICSKGWGVGTIRFSVL